VAAFDLDGTLIKFTGQSSSSNDWEWWKSVVPGKLKEVAEEG
jgi:bifunctional polynucleotide phosphatase/kinase